MAKNDKPVTIELDDGNKLTLRNLKIHYLKKTVGKLREFEVDPEEDNEIDMFDEIDIAMSAAHEALQQDNSEIVEDAEWVEQNLTMQEIEEVLRVCAGWSVEEGN